MGTRRLSSFISRVLVVAALLAPAVAHAEATECSDDTASLRRVLSARHDPPTRERIEGMCLDAAPALIVVATEPARQMERLRAIHALGAFPTAEVRAVLARLSTAERESASIRRTALLALDRASEDDSATLLTTARAALRDADAHVRNAAVRCLADHREARRDLESARRTEREAFVRASIDEALGTSTPTVETTDSRTARR